MRNFRIAAYSFCKPQKTAPRSPMGYFGCGACYQHKAQMAQFWEIGIILGARQHPFCMQIPMEDLWFGTTTSQIINVSPFLIISRSRKILCEVGLWISMMQMLSVVVIVSPVLHVVQMLSVFVVVSPVLHVVQMLSVFVIVLPVLHVVQMLSAVVIVLPVLHVVQMLSAVVIVLPVLHVVQMLSAVVIVV